MKAQYSAAIIGLFAVAALGIWAATAPPPEHEIGSYTTSLRGRTASQIHNARLSLRRLSNISLMPGRTFSFVKTVGTWTADQGYQKAPVSYDGELVRSWGGGVCQTSSTLYNAALLAGLDIVERHRHHWPARYAPLGRDAAVAYSDIDLKFKNNLSEPVRIVAKIEGESLIVRILSRARPKYQVRIESKVRSVTKPREVYQNRTNTGTGRLRLINRGEPGFNVVVYRRFIYPNSSRRQLISEDRYPAMNRVVRREEF